MQIRRQSELGQGMTADIWLCEAPHSTEYQLPFLSCLRNDRTLFMEHLRAIQPLQQANELGLPFDPALMPDKLFWGRNGRFNSKLPPLFHNAFTYLRADVANVVLQHDLGDGALRAMEMYQNDTVSALGETVHAIVIGNAQETLDCGLSQLEPHPNEENRFILPLSTAGKQFRARPGFEPFHDIWADPRVSEGFFLSGRLVEALAGIASPKQLALLPVS